MSLRRVIALAWAVALAGGCDSDEPSGTSVGESSGDEGSSSGANAATGTVTLSFGVSNGVRMGPTLVDPLVGSIYGDLYLTSDVALTGPVEGAMPYASVAVEGVDLSVAQSVDAVWTSEPLPAGDYSFLGMFDLDGNFEQTDHSPDPGDPVTLPNQDFELAADRDTPFMVTFELVYG